MCLVKTNYYFLSPKRPSPEGWQGAAAADLTDLPDAVALMPSNGRLRWKLADVLRAARPAWSSKDLAAQRPLGRYIRAETCSTGFATWILRFGTRVLWC